MFIIHNTDRENIGFIGVEVDVFPAFAEIPPSIIFYLVNDGGDLSEKNHQYLHNHFSHLPATIEEQQDRIIFSLIGGENIRQLLKLYFQFERYANEQNKLINQQLISDHEKLTKLHREATRPPKAKSSTAYTYHALIPPKHNIKQNRVIRRVIKNKNGKSYILKEQKSHKSFTEIEAFNGFCYRLLLGDRAAKTRELRDSEGNTEGVLSEEFVSLWSLHDYLVKYKTSPSKEKLINSEIAKVWFAAYCEEEADLHGGNYGFHQDDKVVKYDHNQATFPLAAKYLDKKEQAESYKRIGDSAVAWPVHTEDIRTFPRLKFARPINWPDRSDRKFIAIDAVIQDTEFIAQKFYMALKRILIDKEVYAAAARATISSVKKQEKYAVHKANKTAALRSALLAMPEFQQFILKHPRVIDNIQREFTEYNQEFYKEKDHYLRVDVNKISQNYQSIVLKIKMNAVCESAVDSLTNYLEGMLKLYKHRPSSFVDCEKDFEKAISTAKDNFLQLKNAIASSELTEENLRLIEIHMKKTISQAQSKINFLETYLLENFWHLYDHTPLKNIFATIEKELSTLHNVENVEPSSEVEVSRGLRR